MLRDFWKELLCFRKQVLCELRRVECVVTFAMFATFIPCEIASASDRSRPPIDDRCESTQLGVSLYEDLNDLCMLHTSRCMDERVLKFNESQEQARELCENRPLILDPRFIGPCPSFVQELETTDNHDKGVLARVYLRTYFLTPTIEHHTEVDRFKRTESIQHIRELIDSDPNNIVALELLNALLDENEILEKLHLQLKLHDLDPDCPDGWWFLPDNLFNHVDKLIGNWLSGKGSGSELSENELKELVQRTRHTLLGMYDLAIDQSHNNMRKLSYALKSLHDRLLTGRSENTSQISDHLEIDPEEFTEGRRISLIHRLSLEHGIDSNHDRTQTLGMICNDYAFQIGLAEHCLDLLTHFGQIDSESGKSIANDWVQAALLLTNSLTLDCESKLGDSATTEFRTDQRVCLTVLREPFTAHIRGWLRKLRKDSSAYEACPECELLEAYLRLDETSDEHFIRALALDGNSVSYAGSLSKRLHKQGEKEAAITILNASKKAVDQARFSSNTWQKRHDIEAIKKSLESVNTSYYQNFYERPRYVLPWEDTEDSSQ